MGAEWRLSTAKCRPRQPRGRRRSAPEQEAEKRSCGVGGADAAVDVMFDGGVALRRPPAMVVDVFDARAQMCKNKQNAGARLVGEAPLVGRCLEQRHHSRGGDSGHGRVHHERARRG